MDSTAQVVRGRNGVPIKPVDSLVRASPSAPLARQNASLGSFDFMKLFESGPNGTFYLGCIPEGRVFRPGEAKQSVQTFSWPQRVVGCPL